MKMQLDLQTTVRLAGEAYLRYEEADAPQDALDCAYRFWRKRHTELCVEEVNAQIETIEGLSREALRAKLEDVFDESGESARHYSVYDYWQWRNAKVGYILDDIDKKQAQPPDVDGINGYDIRSLRIQLMGIDDAVNRDVPNTELVSRLWDVLQEHCPVRQTDVNEIRLGTPYRLAVYNGVHIKAECEMPVYDEDDDFFDIAAG